MQKGLHAFPDLGVVIDDEDDRLAFRYSRMIKSLVPSKEAGCPLFGIWPKDPRLSVGEVSITAGVV